jgi:hypothetical protein
VTALELDLDLGERFVDPEAPLDEAVVNADDRDDDDDDDRYSSGGSRGVGGRTMCVRTCDGFYFPISFSTVQSRFADDEQACKRMCPAAEVVLYSHRNPGEDVARAVSSSGRSYAELPTAFRYRKTYDAACSCRAPGQSWADALRQGGDQTVERGDIVVTEERARILSQPRTMKPDPSKPAANAAPAPAADEPAAAPAAEEKPEDTPPGKRKIRAVGPNVYPVR